LQEISRVDKEECFPGETQTIQSMLDEINEKSELERQRWCQLELEYQATRDEQEGAEQEQEEDEHMEQSDDSECCYDACELKISDMTDRERVKIMQLGRLSAEGRRGRGGKRGGRLNAATRRMISREVNRIAMREKEQKFDDGQIAPFSVILTGTMGSLTSIAQGTTINQRVGDQIRLRGAYLNLTVTAANADITNQVRLLFFQWHPNLATGSPVIANILQTPTTNGVLSHPNVQFQDQFTILFDRLFNLSGVTTAPTANSQHVIREQFILPRRPVVNFMAGSSTNASNTIWYLALSDSSIAPNPSLTFDLRMMFVDE